MVFKKKYTMQDSDYNELLKAVLHRRLTPKEETWLQAYFASHPGTQAAWEEEMTLNQILGRLPDVPLASKFTSQVLQLVEREQSQAVPRSESPWWRPVLSLVWVRKIALGTLVLAFAGFSYHGYQFHIRNQVARSVVKVSESMPALEMLENFEAIRRLDQVPRKVDVELLAALQ
jgi:hypothetical protein